MAKIYSNNKEFNGISASVDFVNGVGVTDDSYLISWFKEHGYTVEIEVKPEDVENMTYKELTDYAKERGFNGIGYKKPDLIKALLELDNNVQSQQYSQQPVQKQANNDKSIIETEE